MTDIWQGYETVMKFAATQTINTSAALDTFFSGGTAAEGILKNYTITPPTHDPSRIALAGTDANGYANAAKENGQPDMAEINGTFVLPKDPVVDALIYGTGTAINSTHTRFSAGKAVPTEFAVLVNLEDSNGNEFNVVLNNLTLSGNDITLTGPDGHYEINYEGKCLPASFYGPEYKDNA